jgi:hypothetical protein
MDFSTFNSKSNTSFSTPAEAIKMDSLTSSGSHNSTDLTSVAEDTDIPPCWAVLQKIDFCMKHYTLVNKKKFG